MIDKDLLIKELEKYNFEFFKPIKFGNGIAFRTTTPDGVLICNIKTTQYIENRINNYIKQFINKYESTEILQ